MYGNYQLTFCFYLQMQSSQSLNEGSFSYLNDSSQEEVISSFLSYSASPFLVVVAPPGSGKTSIIARIIDRIYQRSPQQLTQKPPRFLVLTFTRRTREDLVSILSLMPTCKSHRKQILEKIRSFHSLAFGLFAWKKLLEEGQIEKYIKSVISAMPNIVDKSDMFDKVMKEGQRMLAEGRQECQWIEQSDQMKARGDQKGELLLLYWKFLESQFKECGRTTYDHCLIKAAEEIRTPFHTCKGLDLKQIEYLIVDEFQDCSPAQLRIVDALIDLRKGNLRVLMLGDINQNIYSWRGASLSKFQEFSSKYKPQIKTLNQNFRLGNQAQQISQKLIQSKKDVNTGSEYIKNSGIVVSCNHQSQLPELRRFQSEITEVRWVVDRIYKLKSEGIPLSEMTILLRGFRCTTFFTRFKIQLQRRVEVLHLPEIPYDVQVGQDVMKTQTVKYLLAVMGYFIKGWKKERRDEQIMIICTAIRGVGHNNSILSKMKCHNEIHRKYVDNGNGGNMFHSFLLDFQKIQHILISDAATPRQICYEIVKLFKDAVWGKIEMKEDCVEEFLDTLEAYQQQIPQEKSKSHILRIINRLISSSRKMQQEQIDSSELIMRKRPNRLHIQTIHNAKGMQYRAVFLCSLNFAFTQQQYCKEAKPLLKESQKNEERDHEELRIIYTAITRSSQYMFISCSKKDNFKVGRGEQKHPQFETLSKMVKFDDNIPYAKSLDEPLRQYYQEYQRKKKEITLKTK